MEGKPAPLPWPLPVDQSGSDAQHVQIGRTVRIIGHYPLVMIWGIYSGSHSEVISQVIGNGLRRLADLIAGLVNARDQMSDPRYRADGGDPFGP